MKKVKIINVKPIKTDKLFNKCKCGKKVRMEGCVYVKEEEDIFDIFTKNSKELFRNGNRHLRLEQKYKQRYFFLGVCSCGRLYYKKSLSN